MRGMYDPLIQITVSWSRDTTLNPKYLFGNYVKKGEEEKENRKSSYLVRILVPFHDFHAVNNREIRLHMEYISRNLIL